MMHLTWADEAFPLSILDHVLANAVLDALARLQNFQLDCNSPGCALPDPVEIDLHLWSMPNFIRPLLSAVLSRM